MWTWLHKLGSPPRFYRWTGRLIPWLFGAAALFMAELLLGLLAKAAPQLNLLIIGFGTKSLVLLAVGGAALALLPRAVELIVDMSLTGMGRIAG